MRDLRGGLVRTSLALALGALALTGCSEKQEASTSLPTPSASETTPELPPLGPEDMPMPDEARTQDAAGAEAFVRYYVDLINRTSRVMDAEPLRQFSDGCRDCNRIADNTEEASAAGRAYRDGQITITEFAPPLLNGTVASVAITFDQAELTVVDSASNRVEDGSSEAYPGLPGGIGLRWDDRLQSWLITDFTVG
ncbi:DUF6318 family protein [Blastococcus xanthinilyticus]|uniref:DUF6318 domain-containing protein n=1 Tax=Blastococcus xanthinilyticus TaxID=1564164 RepID=A0A5S5D6C9_9ACTN|nr:DUF6318 family protein [Blastococcus xanthinilyticus]TYP90828.1 hypothetical protein BD833_101547 [Blastococcus xanthinilyticus]